jgi:anti-sigma factor RsiW
MDHLNQAKWSEYVKGQLPNDLHSELEKHLYECEECLVLYMQTLDEIEIDIEPSSDFTDVVMNHISTDTKKDTQKKSVFLHYAVAAAITLALMFSGVFEGIANAMSEVEQERAVDTSVSERILDKSLLWLDQIKTREGRE